MEKILIQYNQPCFTSSSIQALQVINTQSKEVSVLAKQMHF